MELVCRPDRLAYAVRDGIPVMLPEEARLLKARRSLAQPLKRARCSTSSFPHVMPPRVCRANRCYPSGKAADSMGVGARRPTAGAASVIVATDDARIQAAALGFGAECVMTGAQHVSGTDRIAEVVRARALPPDDVVVNVQGDEPMMPARGDCAAGGRTREPSHHRYCNGSGTHFDFERILGSELRQSATWFGWTRADFSRAPFPGHGKPLSTAVRLPMRARGGISASMPIGCAVFYSSRPGPRRRSKSRRSSSSCVRWSMA